MTTVIGLVLAGGEGRRMGGVDKGLQPWRGQPLATHVLQALQPQVSRLMVSANRHHETYATFGHPVLADPDGLAFAGPLAGMLAGLQAIPDDAWLLTAPCDSPLPPADLAARLFARPAPRPAARAAGALPRPWWPRRAALDARAAAWRGALQR
jgi:molybdenum cofactor guanylyltransferase